MISNSFAFFKEFIKKKINNESLAGSFGRKTRRKQLTNTAIKNIKTYNKLNKNFSLIEYKYMLI